MSVQHRKEDANRNVQTQRVHSSATAELDSNSTTTRRHVLVCIDITTHRNRNTTILYRGTLVFCIIQSNSGHYVYNNFYFCVK